MLSPRESLVSTVFTTKPIAWLRSSTRLQFVFFLLKILTVLQLKEAIVEI